MDGWGCGRELNGGGQAGAAAAGWTVEPKTASSSYGNSRVASAAIQIEDGFNQQKVESMSQDKKRLLLVKQHSSDSSISLAP